MQSYEHHIVHESLEIRHPYLQDPFTADIDPTQITIAVFDRMIPKFKEVLTVEELDHSKCRDALKTLNQLVHHQETMDKMIEAELLQISQLLLKHQDAEVREQAALLISAFAISAIGRQQFDYAFPNLRELLEDPELPVREAAAWAFQRLSINDDGCQRIVQSGCAEAMIDSFIKHSNEKNLQGHDAIYLIHLLEAFVNLTFSDMGIQPLLGKNAIAQFSLLLGSTNAVFHLGEHHNKIAELCLRVLGNMSINHEGKQECIDNKVIEASYVFLEESDQRSYEDALNTSLILMSCSIHLEGKNQIVHKEDMSGIAVIIRTIIYRLEDMRYPDLRNNLKVVLTNVAELPLGFSKITLQLCDKIEILDEVFGPRCVKPLHNFLLKLSDYDDVLHIDENEAFKGVMVIRALAYIFKKYKEVAAQVAIDETINFAEKLAPFINPEYGVQREVFDCLTEICAIDSFNCHILQKFIMEHGEKKITINMNSNQLNVCTIKHELFQHCPEILELAMEARILT